MTDYDPLAELLDQMDADRPPADLVRPEMTLDDVKQANEMAGRDVTVTFPGDVMVDLDGLPTAVEPSTTSTAMFAGLTITKAQADRLGVTQERFPHVHIA